MVDGMMTDARIAPRNCFTAPPPSTVADIQRTRYVTFSGQNMLAYGNCEEGIALVCQKNAQKMKLASSRMGSIQISALIMLVNLVPVSSVSRNRCAAQPTSL